MSTDIECRAERKQLFKAVWRTLAIQGCCDELGGIEYRRVFASWVNSGYPGYGEVNADYRIGEFIRQKANEFPSVTN